MNFGARIKQQRLLREWSQQELATRAGLPPESGQQTVAAIEDRDSKRSQYAQQLCDALRIDIRWALSGEGEAVQYGAPSRSTTFSANDGGPQAFQFLYVDRVSGPHLSAGTGEVVWDFEEIEHSHAFRRDWMQKNGYKPERCKLYEVRGESMAPTLNSGDMVMINMADRTVIAGELYALVAEDGLRVKRLHKRAGGIWMHSDNPDQLRYPPELIEDQHAAVIGRVVWRGGAL